MVRSYEIEGGILVLVSGDLGDIAAQLDLSLVFTKCFATCLNPKRRLICAYGVRTSYPITHGTELDKNVLPGSVQIPQVVSEVSPSLLVSSYLL